MTVIVDASVLVSALVASGQEGRRAEALDCPLATLDVTIRRATGLRCKFISPAWTHPTQPPVGFWNSRCAQQAKSNLLLPFAVEVEVVGSR